ncbi:hypothetical protein [Methanosarcina sp.]|uniref:hypothetical protein n=1 Tax=Methanosarcina sp. TaxID=2213 RepID=UPI002ABAD58D|nr:hypothetical protein [Methanosarcina sp.]MDY9927855.1 hypothetical protein [Methanosarcina sp.]
MDNSENPNYTYEEIRNTAIDILAGRVPGNISQYEWFERGVGNFLSKKKFGFTRDVFDKPMSNADCDIFLEVFWDLFRQGIITLGINDMNPNFPHFRISTHAKKILENPTVYFYHDVSSYEAVIRQQVPNVDIVTLDYLMEAMQSFYSGCYLSSAVMLGVASEHTFLKLLDKIENGNYRSDFQNVFKQRNILGKFTEFRKALNRVVSQNKIILTPQIKENLDSNLDGILNTIRYFRNDSGHPSGNKISREQCYVNLNLFIPYCKKVYQLRDIF